MKTMGKLERLERNYDGDAVKVRSLVKTLRTNSLMELAREIIKVHSVVPIKQELEGLVDALIEANREYRITEGRELVGADGSPIVPAWFGGPGAGRLPKLPADAPEHKVAIAKAWNELLDKVNVLSSVGITYNPTTRRIELLADIDETYQSPNLYALGGNRLTKWD